MVPPNGFHGLCSDAEQQIFTSLMEYSSDLIGIASLSGEVFYLNMAGRNLVGLDGMDGEEAVAIYRRAMASGKPKPYSLKQLGDTVRDVLSTPS